MSEHPRPCAAAPIFQTGSKWRPVSSLVVRSWASGLGSGWVSQGAGWILRFSRFNQRFSPAMFFASCLTSRATSALKADA